METVKSLSNVHSRNPLFLFDGWDEAEDSVKTAFMEIVNGLKAVVVLSCRAAVYADEFNYLLKLKKPYFVMGLPKTAQKRFLLELANNWRSSNNRHLIKQGFKQADEHWVNQLWGQIHQQSSLCDLAGSPLLLTLIAFLNPPNTSHTFAKTKYEFFENAFNWLCINRLDSEKNNAFVSDNKALLLKLVERMHLTAEIPYNTTLEVYREYQHTHPNCLSFNDWKEGLQTTGLMRYDDLKKTFEFLHLTFQEWLLSEMLYNQYGLVGSVKRYWLNPRYDVVLSLMWGMSTIDPEERIITTELLIKKGCVDITKQRPATRSGLQMALLLWASSGIDLEEIHYTELLKKLTNLIVNSYLAKIKASTLLLPSALFFVGFR